MVLAALLAVSAQSSQASGTSPSSDPTAVTVPALKRVFLNRSYRFVAGAVIAEDGLGAIFASGGGTVGHVRFDPASDYVSNGLAVYDEPVATNRFRRAPVLAEDAVFAAEGRVPRGSSWPRGLSTLRDSGPIGAGVLAAVSPKVFLARTFYPSKRGQDGKSSLYSRLDMDKLNVAGKPLFSSEEFRGDPVRVLFDGSGMRFVAATLSGSVYQTYAYAYAKGKLKPEKGGPLAKLAGWRVKIPGVNYLLSPIKSDPVRGRIAVQTDPASVMIMGRDGKFERFYVPDAYNRMAVVFANGRLLANVYNSLGGGIGDPRLLERLGGRWIDRGPAWIKGASASGRVLLIENWKTEEVEVVWVAAP